MCILFFSQCGSVTIEKYTLDKDNTVHKVMTPQGFAVDENGNLYVTAIEHNKLDVYIKGADGKYKIDTNLTITESLSGPQSVAIYKDLMFVSNYISGTVSIFQKSQNGKFVLQKDKTISGLNGNQGLFVKKDGSLYISLFNINQIVVFIPNEDGTYIEDKSKTVKEGLSVPINLTFDAKDNMYVSNWGGNTIGVFDKQSDGSYKYNKEMSVSNYLESPYWVTFDKDYVMYVANYGLNMIMTMKQGESGKYVIDKKLCITDQISSPVCVQIMPDGQLCSANYSGTLTFYSKKAYPADSLKEISIKNNTDIGTDFPNYVLSAEEENDIPVYKMNPDRTITDQILGIQNLTISPDDEIVAANFLSNTVTFYSQDENGIYQLEAKKTISNPNGVDALQFDIDNNLWITQFYNSTVVGYVKDKDGIYKPDPDKTIDKNINGPFSSFMSYDNSMLYSPNFNVNNITLLHKNKDGKYELQETIIDKDNIMGPTGLLVDPEDETIYLANLSFGIVSAYSKGENGKYAFNKTKSIRCNGMTDDLGNVGPYRLLMHNELLYVANYNNGSVFIYKKNKDGIFALAKNRMITGLVGTSGLGIDKDGNLIVSSYGLDKIYVFEKQ